MKFSQRIISKAVKKEVAMIKKRNKIWLLLAVVMVICVYPAYLNNGIFGTVFPVLAAVINLINYFGN